MTIPNYQTFMLPLLQLAGDGQVHKFGDACDHLAEQFDIPKEERLKLLPSGRYPVFRSRVGWAKTYLTKAKLLELPARGQFVITKRGKEILESGITKIDSTVLQQYSEFVEFQRGGADKSKKKDKPHQEQPQPQLEQTPDELLESAYHRIQRSLAEELLEQVKTCSPEFFEKLVIDLLVAMGYGGTIEDAGQRVGQSRDGGIDGIIKEDRLGLDVIYIQAKKWDRNTPVSRPEIQKFVGALQGQHARKGVFITTTKFSRPARDYVKNLASKVVLIDGDQLSQYMIDFNIGVSHRSTYELKQIDTDYFIEG